MRVRYNLICNMVFSCCALLLLASCGNGGGSSSSPSNWTPQLIAFTTTNSPQYGYVASSAGTNASSSANSGNVYQCSLNSNGTPTTCTVTDGGVSSWAPSYISFVTVNGTLYGYVADQSGNVYRCLLNSSTGALATCVASNGGISSWTPYGVVIANVSGTQYGYVADGKGNVYQCQINQSNGIFSSCAVSNGGVSSSNWAPGGLAFATIGSTQYAYVADNTGNIYQCPLNNTGGLTNCTITNGGISGWVPYNVEFITANSPQSAYIADFKGNVYQCPLNGTGGLTNCVITNGGVASSRWKPAGITFATFNATQYGYVADNNGYVYKCLLNSNGALSLCQASS